MSKGQWLLLILAAVVVAAYFGVLGHAVDALDNKIDRVEQKIDQKFDKQEGKLRAKLEKLSKQPGIPERFDAETDWADALFVLALFVFLTPIAIMMVIVIMTLLFSAIAHMIPFIPHRVGVLILMILCAVGAYLSTAYWVPYMQYYAGWVARAFIVVTASKTA